MVFCGDIALPDVSIAIDLPDSLRQQNWFVNLEGSLIEASRVDESRLHNKVFNSQEAIARLSELLHIRVCSLANNHIEDCDTVDSTTRKLEDIGINYVGAGSNISEAERPVYIQEEKLTVLSFGWDVIKCPVASANRSGVNPYKKAHVIETVKVSLQKCESLVCFFHWGYELEAYPLPYDWELAHALIDLGVYSVIGCHAHRVQQIEFYKGKPIVYGLGNFLFPHGYYWNGRLKFPSFTKKELAFELAKDGRFIAHWFEYDNIEKRLSFLYSEELTPSEPDFTGIAPYCNLSPKEYDRFFRANRYHKKLLPVYKSLESDCAFAVKSFYVKFRGRVIDMLVRMNIKARK